MEMPSRAEVPGLWEVEGSLRDVYISPTSVNDWEHLLTLAQDTGARYWLGGSERALPSAKEIFENQGEPHLLVVELGGVSVNCHFFLPDEIELDIDPREVVGEAEHSAVLSFVGRLASLIGRDAVVTPENSQDLPFLRFEAASGKWAVRLANDPFSLRSPD